MKALVDAPTLTTNTGVSFHMEPSDADEKLAWSMESKSKTFDNVGEPIDSVTETIVKRLERDGLLVP
jgi:hypothetical protein